MTPAQLKLIHIARRATGMDDADYRTGLRSIAHVESSKSLTNEGFEDCLAWCESCGWRDTQHHAHFWRDLVDRRRLYANSRQLHEITRLYELIRSAGCPYTLASLVETQCADRTHEPSKLSPQEANSLIEAIKAIRRRVGPCPTELPVDSCQLPANQEPRGMGVSPIIPPPAAPSPDPDESDCPF